MKKFLALVLALVMTMSLVTISAGADFTDDASIKYEEAVDVMTAIGVVGGYADGSFNPQGTLTRGAAAKIICNMILGPTEAGALATVEAPFADVPADHVFSGYIAYCVSEGIVSGYSDGTFRPAGTLTGYAFMKMLLGALGYDAATEGYTGTNYAINVAKRALNIGLDDGLEGAFVGAKALTREEACLYAYNTLKADMVKYENNSSITIGDVVITNSSKAEPVTSVKNSNTIADETSGAASAADPDVVQFAEKYFTKLVKTGANDDFMRPAYKWTYDKTTIGTYVEAPEVVLTATTKAADVKTALDGYTLTTAADVHANGSVDAGWLTSDVYADIETMSGNGKVIEFYDVNGDDIIEDVITIQYTYSAISKVKTTAATKNEGEFVTYTVTGATNTGKVYNTTVDSDEKDTAVLDGEFAAKDKVLYVEAGKGTAATTDDILYIYGVDEVAGVLSAKKSDGKMTVDGETMEAAAVVNVGSFTVSTKEQTFYVDSYGYLVATKAGADPEYAFVLSVATSYAQNEDGTLDPAYIATLIMADGSVKKVYTVDSDGEASNAFWAGLNNTTYNCGVVTYSVNDAGKYEITNVGASARNVAITSINKDNEKMGTIFANGDTVFAYADYKTDGTTLAGTATVVTGLANVATSSPAVAFAVDTDATADNIADVVFVYTNVSATTTSKFIYVTGAYTQTGTSSFEYAAFKGGEATTIVLSATDVTMTEGLYASMTVVGKTKTADVDAVALVDAVAVKVEGGLLKLAYTADPDAFSVAEVAASSNCMATLTSGTIAEVAATVPMYEIDTGDNTCEAIDASVGAEGAVYVEMNTAGDKIVAIYVVHA